MSTKLKVERVRRDLSQQELGEIAQMTAADISRIETCRMVPYRTQAQKLARVLGLREEELQEPAN
jgi:ribosome-binding protein aMBF1 (putative translation factor)